MHRRLLVCFALSLAVSASAAEPGFRAFPDTVSPDDRFVLAWGLPTPADEKLAELKEWPAGAEPSADDGVENFVIDQRSGRVWCRAPDFGHWVSQGMRKNRSFLSVAWDAERPQAVMLETGRYEPEALAWCDLEKKRFVPLQKLLDPLARRALPVKPALRDDYLFYYEEPALLPGGILVIDAEAGRGKEGPYFHFRYRFRLHPEATPPRAELLKAREFRDKDQRSDEEKLDAAYQRLRGTRKGDDLARLEATQTRWLAQHERLPENDRLDFTRQRIAYLRAFFEK